MPRNRNLCKANLCRNSRATCGESISFFSFPTRDPIRCSTWKINCGLSEEQDVKKAELCAQHFEPHMFLRPHLRKRLKHDAVPTLFGTGVHAVASPLATDEEAEIDDPGIPSTAPTDDAAGDKFAETSRPAEFHCGPIDGEGEMDEIGNAGLASSASSTIRRAYEQAMDVFGIQDEPEIPMIRSTSPAFAAMLFGDIDPDQNLEATEQASDPPSPSMNEHGSSTSPQLQASMLALQRKYQASQKARRRQKTSLKKVKDKLRLIWSGSVQKSADALRTKVSSTFGILLNNQVRNFGKSPNGRRYTMEDKLLGISMYQKGPRLYRTMMNTMCLPHPNTLKKTMRQVELLPGMQPAIQKMLQHKINKMKDSEKDCIVMGDEIHLRHGFTYDRRRDRTTGVVDQGHLGRKDQPAKSSMVFMVRSIYGNWKLPISYYFTSSPTGSTLAELWKSVISDLLGLGFRVRAAVCDAPAANKKMFEILGATENSPFVYINGHKIYTLFDPPHLLKAIRNCLANNEIKSQGKTYDWADIVAFYNKDRFMMARIAPKLTDAHMDPNTLEKMGVSRAAQIFSNQVAAGMFCHATLGSLQPKVADTADMLLRVDRLWDSFNGSMAAPRNNKFPLAKPYRYAVEEGSFHFHLWDETMAWLKGWTFVSPSGKAVNSMPIQVHWPWTANAMKMLASELLAEGRKFVPTSRFNQDPLENLFSTIRYNGGNRKKPTPAEFIPALQACLVSRLSTKPKGNCEDDGDEFLVDLGILFQQSQADGNVTDDTARYSEDMDMDIDGPSVEYDGTSVETQADAAIAVALMRKVQPIVNECSVCEAALLQDGNFPTNVMLSFRDDDQQGGRRYPQEVLSQLAACAMKEGEEVYKTLGFHQTGYLTSIKRRVHGQACLQNLELCPEHRGKVTNKIVDYLSKVSLYDQYRKKNRQLTKQDTRTLVTKENARKKHTRRLGVPQTEWQSLFDSIMSGSEEM